MSVAPFALTASSHPVLNSGGNYPKLSQLSRSILLLFDWLKKTNSPNYSCGNPFCLCYFRPISPINCITSDLAHTTAFWLRTRSDRKPDLRVNFTVEVILRSIALIGNIRCHYIFSLLCYQRPSYFAKKVPPGTVRRSTSHKVARNLRHSNDSA